MAIGDDFKEFSGQFPTDTTSGTDGMIGRTKNNLDDLGDRVDTVGDRIKKAQQALK